MGLALIAVALLIGLGALGTGKMFLIAGLLDAVPMIGVGIGMYVLFVIVPTLTGA